MTENKLIILSPKWSKDIRICNSNLLSYDHHNPICYICYYFTVFYFQFVFKVFKTLLSFYKTDFYRSTHIFTDLFIQHFFFFGLICSFWVEIPFYWSLSFSNFSSEVLLVANSFSFLLSKYVFHLLSLFNHCLPELRIWVNNHFLSLLFYYYSITFWLLLLLVRSCFFFAGWWWVSLFLYF